jgi:hypothetical protein
VPDEAASINDMAKLTESQDRALRVAYFIVGLALPLIAWKLWGHHKDRERHQEIDEAHDVTVEDSFPASDPPSAW